MKTAALLAALLLAAAPVAAQETITQTTDTDSKLSELVVVAHPQGPPLWRIENGAASMVILGAVTPMQQQQLWEQRPLFAALDDARLLMTPPKPDMGPLQVLALLTGDVWKVRQRQPVESLMPPDLKARFVAARSHAYQKEDRYAHWKPAVAGFLLLSDYRRSWGFSEGKPATTVEKAAKDFGVPVRSMGSFKVGALIKVARHLDDRQQMACLAGALDQMEYEGAHAQTLNDDWAHGDVRSVAARYQVSALQQCLVQAPGARALIDQELDKAADRLWGELQKPGKTVAVVDIAWLMPQGGLLDRLKAKGAVVGPPPALRDVPVD